MSTTIEDLSVYGNMKGRDFFGRNLSQMVKGTGSTPVQITQSFYGIDSTSTSTQELSRFTATESAVDTKIASLNVGIYNGTTMNTVMTLNNTESKVNASKVTFDTDGTYKSFFAKNGSTTLEQSFTDGTNTVKFGITGTALKLTAANTTLTGALHTNGTILKDDLAKAAKISLIDSNTAPEMDFILGNLTGSPSTPLKLQETLVTMSQDLQMSSKSILDVPLLQNNTLAHGAKMLLNTHASAATVQFLVGTLSGSPVMALELTETAVNVASVLNVGGVNVLDLMTNTNPWAIDDETVYLKADYNLVQVNGANPYTADLALDVNGSLAIRGNDLFMYDSAGLANLNTLHYDDVLNDLHIRTSLASQGGATDNIIFETTDGTDNTYLTRFNIGGGTGVQPATLSNVNLGIGSAPSGTYKLEVQGKGYFSDVLAIGANIDALNHDLVNVAKMTSTTTLTKQAQITLTSHATTPTMQLQVGALTGTPVILLSEVLATINPDSIFNNDVTIKGNTLNFWDGSASAALPQLEYIDGTSMQLRSLISGESLILQTTGDASNAGADRLVIGTGDAAVAYFTSSTRLGVGATPSSTYRFECSGTSNFTGDVSFQSNLDMTLGNIDNVVNLQNIDAGATLEGARINLVQHATNPTFDFYLGDFTDTPVDVLTLSKTLATFNTALEAYGNLDMHNNSVLNAATVSNKTLALGSEIQLNSSATAPNMNFVLGDFTGTPATVLTLTPSTFVVTKGATFNDAVQVDLGLTVNTTSTLVGDVSTSVLKKDSTATSAGASAIELGIGNNGIQFTALATTGNVLSATSQMQIIPTEVDLTVDLNMQTHNIIGLTSLVNNNPASKGAEVTFTSGVSPKVDFILGNLAGTPVTAVTVKDTAVDFNVPVNFTAGNVDMTNNLTVHGDLTVSGTTTTINSTTVTVNDINIVLADNATTNAELNGAGITIGGASIVSPPMLTYSNTDTWWNSNIDFNVETGKSISVAGTGAVLSETGLQFASDTAAVYLGGTQEWKLAMVAGDLVFQHNDGSGFVTKFAISAS